MTISCPLQGSSNELKEKTSVRVQSVESIRSGEGQAIDSKNREDTDVRSL
jgi:hypothetical protein